MLHSLALPALHIGDHMHHPMLKLFQNIDNIDYKHFFFC